jgi:hypothetical protein
MLNLNEQFVYVNKVVNSCKTEKQKEHVYGWAQDWAKRMKRSYPNKVYSYTDLFLDVISTK